MKRAQTATEYMVILAVVIIIAVIVVSALGGVPSIGGDVQSRASEAYWQSADMAIYAYSMSASNDHSLKIRNNKRDQVRITNINMTTSPSGSYQEFSTTDKKLSPGGTHTFTNTTAFDICTDEGETFKAKVKINYVDQETGAEYVFTGEENQLVGTCAK
ncbi:MAG: hypothetical protein ACQEP1_06500 [Nanobdellota archaeon]